MSNAPSVDTNPKSVQTISVIVPDNPFVSGELGAVKHCLAALDVVKLMEWWPGNPHSPHRDSSKVTTIQRSLDWKRVAQIAAYLLQREILDVASTLDEIFRPIYEPKKYEPGREWPPRVPKVIGYEPSDYPTFSNILVHVNGAELVPTVGAASRAQNLVFNEKDKALNFSIIDGQHRINGAYLAVTLLSKQSNANTKWEIPAEVFVDLDKPNAPPRHQAQIFIDVNFYQKKVDRSLVADLFPTARGGRKPLDDKERAQDLGRKLMLEVGPLVGMIQIPGIRYGVKDVVTLATLNSALEDILSELREVGLDSLEEQAEFLGLVLSAWLQATGWAEEGQATALSSENVVYQGRILVSVISLIPGCLVHLRTSSITFISKDTEKALAKWFKKVAQRAQLIQAGKFVPKTAFRELGFLGSGGIARLRDLLWASVRGSGDPTALDPDELAVRASKNRRFIREELAS